MSNKTSIDEFNLFLEAVADSIAVEPDGLIKESDNLYSLYSGNYPVCKILYGKTSSSDDKAILISLFIELTPVEAIKWFDILLSIHPAAKLIESYMHNTEGQIVFGEEAVEARAELVAEMIITQHYEELDKEDKFISTHEDTGDKQTPLYNKKEALLILKHAKKSDKDDVH